ncbi:hypothetical protein OA978_00405 [Candidatus Pelagibacter sp.]|nr:hypothetical protein [Candidatus Pelagibacter sp.]
MVTIDKSIRLNITDRQVVKQSDPSLMKIEYEKHAKAYELGIKSNLFKVPKIYDYDSQKGIIIMEYFPNIQRYDSISKPSDEIVIKIAECLSFIHDNLTLTNKINSSLINELGTKYKSFIHGDFNGQNVCIDKLDGKIIILDWQTAPLYGGKATYESRLFDLMWFATYSLRVPRKKDLNFLRTIKLSKLFIKSYLKTTKEEIDKNYFYNYANSFILKQLKYKKKISTFKIKESLFLRYSIFLNLIFLKQLKKIYT